MSGFVLIAFSLIMLLCVLPIPAMAAHPAAGHEAESLERRYGGGKPDLPPAWDYGEITRTTSKPEAHTLTELERYMVAGSRTSNLPGQPGLGPWVLAVYL